MGNSVITMRGLCKSYQKQEVLHDFSLTVERGHRGLYFLHGQPPAMREAPLLAGGKTQLAGLCEIEAGPAAPVPVKDDPWRQALDADALEGAVVPMQPRSLPCLWMDTKAPAL